MPMSSEAYLVLGNLYKSYDGEQNAVADVSLSVAKGEFVSFLGPSGSGKTTTLMMIAGFEQPSAGSIHLNGRRLDHIASYRRNIGIVFQNYALFPHMTIRRNIGFPLRMRKAPAGEIDRRVGRALEMVGLSAYGERRPRELSGGQQQRVALARALVFEPDILLLDEPLGALDKNLREHMQVEIKRIHRELGITTIYVTHDQSEAMTLSDRLVVFNQGRIEQVGDPLAVYRRPHSVFVAEFIGDCNRLNGKVRDRASGIVELEGCGPIRIPEAAGWSHGEDVQLVLRPEFVRPGKGGKDELSFSLAVEGVVHYGDTAVVIGRWGDKQIRMRALSYDAAGIEEGSTIAARAETANLWLLPQGG